MNQLEQNIMNSFRLAKSDIIQLQTDVIELSQVQERLTGLLDDLKAKEMQLYQRVKANRAPKVKTKTVVKTIPAARVKKIYVASKEGTKFHIKNCPFAQNIKPKSKVIFKTKASPLNKGYRACKCVK